MPGFKLTEGYIDLTIDNSKITKALGVVGKALQKVHDTIIRTTKRIATLSLALSTISLRAFANFETAMRKATSVSEASEQQFKRMSDMAIEQSERLNVSATKAADAFYFLGSAGLDVTQQMKAFVPVATLARAATIEMGQAADILVGTMKGFALTSEHSEKVTDVLSKAVISSNMNYEQLGQTLSMVSGVAKLTNNSLEETVAVIATMADINIRGTRAGTSLRRALLNLAAPLSSINQELDKWGVAVFDSQGKMKPFIQLVGELGDKLKNASEEERNMAFRVIFGARAIAGQIAIFDRGADSLDQFTKELENSGGTAQRIADKQMKSFGNQIGIIWQKIKNLTRVIGEALAPGILRLAKATGEMIDMLKEWGNKHMLTIQEWGEKSAVWINLVRKTLVSIVKFMITDWPTAWKFAFGTVETLAIAMRDTVVESFKQMMTAAILHIEILGIKVQYIIDQFLTMRKAMLLGPIAGAVYLKKIIPLQGQTAAQGILARRAKLEGLSGPFANIGSIFKDAAKKIADSVPKQITEEFSSNFAELRKTIEQIEDKYQRLRLNALVNIAERQAEAATKGTGGGDVGQGGVRRGGAGGFIGLVEGWKRLASATAGGVQQQILVETRKARHERLKQDRIDKDFDKRQNKILEGILEAVEYDPAEGLDVGFL